MNDIDRRRVAILTAAYLALALIAFLAWLTVDFYVGTIAVIPMLFISYYSRPAVALTTAFAAGFVIALLHVNVIPHGNFHVPPVLELFTLSLALCTIVVVARRLREAYLSNQLLRGSLVQARRAAERDTLTGMVNRGYFVRKLADAAKKASTGEQIAILFCDLDGFKGINDTHGHLVGDTVLRMAASRLGNTVRAQDVVARLGGDEFGVLVAAVHDESEPRHMAEKIERAFSDPFQADNESYRIGITVGISMCPADGNVPETLLRVADARMYRAKDDKRSKRVCSR
ncbi:MAG TPA: GGDEF domain-containing protein [Candidatus Baltobacteraceae bacterium]|nr:GGDEF domain-containing protein [Candidatus Baltobacteraceae bacterium]